MYRKALGIYISHLQKRDRVLLFKHFDAELYEAGRMMQFARATIDLLFKNAMLKVIQNIALFHFNTFPP